MIAEIINTIGLIAFATSGALKGMRYKLDVFGVTVLGLLTSLGGGILRDVILGKIPNAFIYEHEFYIAIVVSLLLYFTGHTKLEKNKYLKQLVKYSDALGLSLFAIVGAKAGLEAGLGILSTSLITVITCTGGGVIRDLFVNEVPFILREDVYAILVFVAGGAFWFTSKNTNFPEFAIIYSIMLLTFMARVIAILYELNIPRKQINEIKKQEFETSASKEA